MKPVKEFVSTLTQDQKTKLAELISEIRLLSLKHGINRLYLFSDFIDTIDFYLRK